MGLARHADQGFFACVQMIVLARLMFSARHLFRMTKRESPATFLAMEWKVKALGSVSVSNDLHLKSRMLGLLARWGAEEAPSAIRRRIRGGRAFLCYRSTGLNAVVRFRLLVG